MATDMNATIKELLEVAYSIGPNVRLHNEDQQRATVAIESRQLN
jgi:hypothetical protein